jgi:hypothetical protein
MQPADDTEIFRQLKEGSTLFGPGWRWVDNFEEVDDDLEDDEEEVSCSGRIARIQDPADMPGIRRDGSRHGDGFTHTADRGDVPAYCGFRVDYRC